MSDRTILSAHAQALPQASVHTGTLHILSDTNLAYKQGLPMEGDSSAKGENIAGANSGKSGMSDLEAVSIGNRAVSLGVCGKLETVRGKTEKCM